jgi:hypothetical protein
VISGETHTQKNVGDEVRRVQTRSDTHTKFGHESAANSCQQCLIEDETINTVAIFFVVYLKGFTQKTEISRINLFGSTRHFLSFLWFLRSNFCGSLTWRKKNCLKAKWKKQVINCWCWCPIHFSSIKWAIIIIHRRWKVTTRVVVCNPRQSPMEGNTIFTYSMRCCRGSNDGKYIILHVLLLHKEKYVFGRKGYNHETIDQVRNLWMEKRLLINTWFSSGSPVFFLCTVELLKTLWKKFSTILYRVTQVVYNLL